MNKDAGVHISIGIDVQIAIPSSNAAAYILRVVLEIHRLKVDTIASLDRFSQWMYYFFLIRGGERALRLSESRLQLTHEDGTVSTYNLKWQEAEAKGDIFLRKEEGFLRKTIYERQDALDLENQRLQEEILKRMEGRMEVRHIMTIGFEIA